MKNKIKDIFENGGMKIYLIIKSENERKLKLLNAHREVVNKIKELLTLPMQNFLLKMDDCKDIKDAYDNTNSIYHLSASTFDPFKFFEETTECFDKNDILDGFAILVGYDNKRMWIYQNIYQTAIIKTKNKVSITYDNESYMAVKNDIISFEKRIDAIKIEDTYFIENYKIIEKKFDYKELIRNISEEVIQTIKKLNIVDDIEKIQAIAGEDKMTFAKKIMRAKDSPIFNLKKEDLVDKAKNSESYSKLIKNDEFIIDTKEKAKKFIIMLNDQILKSELTGEIYDAQVKVKIVS